MEKEEAYEKSIEGGYKSRKPQEWQLGHYRNKNYYYINIIHKLGYSKCQVDIKDLGRVSKFRWYLKDKYAVATIKGKKVRMHHLILGKPDKDKVIDHKNRDPLDNRRLNLRIVSRVLNSQNNVGKGIRKHGNRWEVNICLSWKKIFKSFPSKDMAIKWRKKIKIDFLKHLAEGKTASDYFKTL